MEYTISNNTVSLTISSLGAEMRSLKKDGTEYLWNGDPRYWSDRSPLLFPFVGRFTEGRYRFGGKEYKMDIHGFARKMEYGLVEKSEDRITFILHDCEATYESYPFHFALEAGYLLQGTAVEIRYKVRNLSDRIMYFGIGGHPGFRLPLEEGLTFSDYYLEFGEKHRPDRVGHTNDCFLNGVSQEFQLEDNQRLRLRHHMFDEDAIVLRNVADKVMLQTDRGTRSVELSYPGLPYLGLWHAPGTEAPYICIEPWTSLPSRQGIIEELQYKSDLIRLMEGSSYETAWKITLH